MKKFLAFATTMIMTLGLAACAGPAGNATENGTQEAERAGNTAVTGQPAAAAAAPVADFSGEIGGEITVSTFDSMLTGPFLEEAAQLFMDKHPGTTVIVESFSAMPEVRRTEGAGGTTMMVTARTDNAQERRDYINMVNTELMSGRGPDILAMDILPFHEYARTGQLVNLRSFMDADTYFDINDYRVNIFDALTTEMGQFVFPVDYAFRYVAFDSYLFTEDQQAPLLSGDVFSFESLIEIGQQPFESINAGAEEPTMMFGMTAGPRPGLFGEIFSQNYSRFVDIHNRTAHFDDGAFVDLLNNLIAFEEAGYLRPRADLLTAESVMRSPDMLEQMMSERFFFKPRPGAMLLNEFTQGLGQRGGMMMIGAGIGHMEDDVIAGLMGNDRGEVPFTVNQGFGINSNSDNQQTAWEFIKFLSSEAVRVSMRMAGLPTHIGAFEERTELSIIGALFDPGQAVEEMDSQQREVFDAYVAQVNYFTNRLNTFFTTDAIVEDIVMTEVQEFFDGSRSAEEVAQTLQSRINLFLNE